MLKLVFAGTPDVAVPSLKAFAADPRFDVVASSPPRRAYRPRPQAHAQPGQGDGSGARVARHRSQTRSPEFMEALNNLHADIAAVIAYGNILPKNVLDAVPMAGTTCISPTCRSGVAPLPPSVRIWAGEPDHRRDVFKVGEGLDDGPIVASLTIELTGRETSGELLDRLAEEGAPMYVDAWPPWVKALPHSPRNRPKAWNTRTKSRWKMLVSAGRTRPRPSTVRFAPARHILGHGPNCLRRGQSPIMTSRPPNPSPCIFSPRNRPTSPIPTLRPSFSPASVKVGKKNVWLVPAARRWNSPKSRRRARRPCAPPTGPEARASPPPPACDNKQYRSRPEAQQKARHLREEDTGLFSYAIGDQSRPESLLISSGSRVAPLSAERAKAAYAFSAWETWRLR